MRECNICTRRGCATVDSYRRKKNPLTAEHMSQHCPHAELSRPFSQKMLYHVLISSPQATMEILARAKIEIRETDRYPGFKLHVGGDA